MMNKRPAFFVLWDKLERSIAQLESLRQAVDVTLAWRRMEILVSNVKPRRKRRLIAFC